MDRTRSFGPARRTTVLCAGLTLLAAALRLWGLGDRSLWYDEFATLSVVRETAGRWLTADPIHPPGYYLLLGAWTRLFGDGPFLLRLPSAILGAAVVPAVHGLAVAAGARPRVALLAATLVALSPFDVYFSQEARMYALALVAVAGAAGTALRWDAQPSWGRLARLFAWCAAGVLLHHAAVLVAAACALVVSMRRDLPLGRRAAMTATLALCGLPALVRTMSGVPLWAPPEPPGFLRIAHEVALAFVFGFPSTLDPPPFALDPLRLGSARWARDIALVVFVLPALALGWRALADRPRVRRALAALVLVPLAGLAAASLVRHVFNERHAAIAAPALYLMLAEGVGALCRRRARWAAALALVALMAYGAYATHAVLGPFNGEGFREAARFLRARAPAGELVAVVPARCAWMLAEYDPGRPVVGLDATAADARASAQAVRARGAGALWVVSFERGEGRDRIGALLAREGFSPARRIAFARHRPRATWLDRYDAPAR